MLKNLDINNKIFSFHLSTNKNSLEQSFSSEDFEPLLNNEKNDNSDKNIMINNDYKEKDFYLFNNTSNDNLLKLDSLSEQNFNDSIESSNKNKSFYFIVCGLPLYLGEKDTYKKEKIFHITKKNKKIGRIKKNSLLTGKHNKLSQDNIIRKIKGRFHEKVRIYINNEYKNYLLNKNKKLSKIIFLKKINPKVSRKIRKEDNLKWFQSKICEIFSENVSLRYSSFSPDSNKKKIKRVISLNEAKGVVEILNTTVETLFDKYISNESIPGFKTLKDDIEELELQMRNENQEGIEEYLKKYEYIATNMKKKKKNKKKKLKNNNSNNKSSEANKKTENNEDNNEENEEIRKRLLRALRSNSMKEIRNIYTKEKNNENKLEKKQ